MPKNKKESFIFTLMMCTIMVLVMTFYNMFRSHGTEGLIVQTLIGFPLGFVVAFVGDWFLVGPLAKKVAFKFVGHNDPVIKKALVISSCMVTGMVIYMSLFGAIMGVGFTEGLLMAWLINIPLNFIVALPLQLVVAGPIVRFGFSKVVAQAA